MRVYDQRHVDTAYLALLESVLKGIGDTSEMTINYLVADVFSQREIDTWKILIESERSGLQREFAIKSLTDLVEATAPFVGQTLVRSGVWFDGRFLQLYIDPIARTIVHNASVQCPNPIVETDA